MKYASDNWVQEKNNTMYVVTPTYRKKKTKI